MKKFLVYILLVLPWSCGCIQVLDFTPSHLEQSKPLESPGEVRFVAGETTTRQVWMWFGSPTKIIPRFEGEKEVGCVWLFAKNDPALQTDRQKQNLWIEVRKKYQHLRSVPKQTSDIFFDFDENNRLLECRLN